MLKATLAALAMVTFCALAVPATHFVGTAQAWTCNPEDEGCSEGGDGGVDDGGPGGPVGNSGPGSEGKPPATGDNGGDGGINDGGEGGGISDGSGDDGGKAGTGGTTRPTIVKSRRLQKLEDTCNGALQKLVKIPESLVESYTNSGGVTVVGVCNSGLGHKASIDGSQALPLQTAIAGNPALAGPLQQHGYRVEDVVGIVLFSNDVATLYVHKGTL